MAGFSLLALLDDITSILDDVALMTKVAAKKTTSVLSDDLALNAQQVSGVTADRELPVILAVAKGSLVNKLILIPVALIISTVMPSLIKPLLMVGGAYLSFEGAEKLFHKFFHKPDQAKETNSEIQPEQLPETEHKTLEKRKIRGAIRTDFVLSAEIIIIALGTVPDGASLGLRAGVLVLIGLLMTALVYGVVAGIVKLDDLGFWLLRKHKSSVPGQKLGSILVGAAPKLMRILAVVGTAAMFLVGGGILLHGLPYFERPLAILASWPVAWLWLGALNMVVGIIVGAALFTAISSGKKIIGALKHRS